MLHGLRDSLSFRNLILFEINLSMQVTNRCGYKSYARLNCLSNRPVQRYRSFK